MSQQDLQNSLKQLHEEINQAVPENEQHEESINTLLENIQPMLDNPGDVSFDHHRKLLTGLKEAVELFKISHPTLTSVLETVISDLNAVGI